MTLWSSDLPRSRRLVGVGVAAVGMLMVTLLMIPGRASSSGDSELMWLLGVAVIASALGGPVAAVLATLLGLAIAAYFFTVPYGSFVVRSREQALDLVVFVGVALLVAFLTEAAARSRHADDLRRIDVLRSGLVSAVSHDLRSPLAGIKASVVTLRDGDLDLCAEDRSLLLESIEEECDRLTGFVTNLLDMRRVQAGAIAPTLAPVKLADVLSAAVPADADLVVDIAPDVPLIRVDGDLLGRALGNLVENALRQSSEQVVVTARRHANRVEIRVIDRGEGVPPDRYDEIFQPFQRLGDQTSGGVGLGLAIARGFIESMGGTLRPTPTEGGGLTMVITLAGY